MSTQTLSSNSSNTTPEVDFEELTKQWLEDLDNETPEESEANALFWVVADLEEKISENNRMAATLIRNANTVATNSNSDISPVYEVLNHIANDNRVLEQKMAHANARFNELLKKIQAQNDNN